MWQSVGYSEAAISLIMPKLADYVVGLSPSLRNCLIIL